MQYRPEKCHRHCFVRQCRIPVFRRITPCDLLNSSYCNEISLRFSLLKYRVSSFPNDSGTQVERKYQV